MLKTKVKPLAIHLLLWFLAISVAVNLLSRIGLWDFTLLPPDHLLVIGSLFVLVEIGIFHPRKIKGISWLGAIVAGVVLLSFILGWIGTSLGLINSIKGISEFGLLIFVLLEIFWR